MSLPHREIFYNVWSRYQEGCQLTPFETSVLDVLLKYPNYINDLGRDKAYDIECNPYFIMGICLAVRDQIKTNRPFGIREWYTEKCHLMGSEATEELMMTVLKESVLQAYGSNELPCETLYLKKLQKF